MDSCEAGAPTTELCNGVDDDCDGTTDEDFAATTTQCGIGACAAADTLACVDGAEVDSCAPGAPAANDATCDSIDDDCDGTTDEAYLPGQTSCGVGACAATGTLTCVDGDEVAARNNEASEASTSPAVGGRTDDMRRDPGSSATAGWVRSVVDRLEGGVP